MTRKTVSPRKSRIRIGAMLAAIVISGCGGGDTGVQLTETTAVEPGTMVTVSITPIEAPAPPDLIRNGDFQAWQTGASAPDFFMAPASNAGHSTLEPTEGLDGEGGAVRQIWQSNDALDAYTGVFRCWVTGLHPNTQYRVAVNVHNLSPNELLLRAFQYNARSPAEAELMTEKPSILGGVAIGSTAGFQETGFTFTTGAEPEFCVLLAVKNNAVEGTFPATCVWDAWRLHEVPAQGPEPS